MKFGLRIENNTLIASFGGIGEYLANCIPQDYFRLKDILVSVSRIKNNQAEKLRVQWQDYKYLIIDKEIVTAYLYDEFEEEGDPEVEMGFIKTSDFVVIIKEYMEILKTIDTTRITTIESIYDEIDALLKEKETKIYSIIRNSKIIDIMLQIGKENLAPRYIRKSYRISLENEQMKLVKNRQYTNNAPLLFELSPKGTNKLIVYLQKDIDLWFEEKMKMYYEGNKLIVIPDDSDVEPIA